MKHCIVGGLAAMLMAGGLIAAAPPASVIMRTANSPSLAAWAASSELKKLVAGADAGSGILAKTDEPCVSAPAGFSPTAAFFGAAASGRKASGSAKSASIRR